MTHLTSQTNIFKSWLLSMINLSSIKLGIIFMIKIIFISPRLFFRIIREYCVVCYLLKKSKTIFVNFNGSTLQGPNEHGFFYSSIEVFYRQLYRKLKGCKHILDLGGYLGESAVWLSLYNDQVTVVEPNPSNFDYLVRNISNYVNINGVEGAIVYQNCGQLYHRGGDFSAGGNITTIQSDTPIDNILISDLWKKDIDGIKMDIEGGEYDIISFLQTDVGLQLIKGYIEFHDILEHRDYIASYIHYLCKHSYFILYEDIYGKDIDEKTFFNCNIAVLYFHK